MQRNQDVFFAQRMSTRATRSLRVWQAARRTMREFLRCMRRGRGEFGAHGLAVGTRRRVKCDKCGADGIACANSSSQELIKRIIVQRFDVW